MRQTLAGSVSVATSIIVILIYFWWPVLRNTEFGPWHNPRHGKHEHHSRDKLQITLTNFRDHLSPITFENATSVFNTINNALKQKGSDLNPVGVSIIPAFIPEGTLLYHSKGGLEFPSSPEWIAMDAEFSYSFRSGFRRGMGPGPHPNGSHPGGPGGPPPGDGPHDHTNDRKPSKDKKPPFDFFGGESALFTFRVKRNLDKLILLDGASAAKTKTGEMDTQLILSRGDPNKTYVNEREAAREICKWGKPFGLDGVIRLEIGFEIIICDFKSEKLELISNITFVNATEFGGFPQEELEFIYTDHHNDNEDNGLIPSNKYSQNTLITSTGNSQVQNITKERADILSLWHVMTEYDHLRAGGMSYDGDPRIELDFRRMVTAINRTFVLPDPYLRRISNISNDIKEDMISDLEVALRKGPFDPSAGTDWRRVTDSMIYKFAPILSILNSTFTSFEENIANSVDYDDSVITAAKNISTFTYNFVRRFSDHNIKDKTEQILKAKDACIYEYSHPRYPIETKSELLIWSSVVKVTEFLVDEIFSVFQLSKDILVSKYVDGSLNTKEFHEDILHHSKYIRDVLNALDWSVFYQCDKKCKWNELCYFPVWGPSPFGWNGGFGSVPVNGRNRIVKECQCIDYNTLLQQGRKW